jgi:hypothetical protein
MAASPSQQEMNMKWMMIFAALPLCVACGTNEQSVGSVQTSEGQSKTVKDSSNISQTQTNPDSNKQSLNVENANNVSQSQSGRNNEQSLNAKNASNVSQSQSGWGNKQSMTIGGTGK